MHNPLVPESEAAAALEALGAEPLSGSGFENEPTAWKSILSNFPEEDDHDRAIATHKR